jgi:spoIIIJ-associated protein
MEQKVNEIIRSILENILMRMNISAEITETELLDSPCFDIHSPDSRLLIGENGQHLLALYAVIRRITEKQFEGSDLKPFIIDVQDYQRKRIEETKERARMSAQRVRYFKKEVIMQPMSAYERRIIHMALSGDPDVTTESMGEGEMRRVVIRPVN